MDGVMKGVNIGMGKRGVSFMEDGRRRVSFMEDGRRKVSFMEDGRKWRLPGLLYVDDLVLW